MFKICFVGPKVGRPPRSIKVNADMGLWYKLFSCAGLIASLLLSSGCGTLSPSLPPVNLDQPGWTVHQGQAVWKLPSGKNDIAGDVLVANAPGGQGFVQFTKSP